MLLADHHCHIFKEYYDDPISLLRECESDLEFVVSMGTDFDTNQEMLDLKKSFDSEILRIGIGYHPEEVIKDFLNNDEEKSKKTLSQIKENSSKANYIGETGIDLFYENSDIALTKQIEVFEDLLELSMHVEMPVSIHCRNSTEQIITSIKKVLAKNSSKKLNGFLHCFTGNFEEGVFFIESGLRLGLGGIITFKKSTELVHELQKIRAYFSTKTLDELFGLETDAPFLTPEPIRSEKNKPLNVKFIDEFVRMRI